MGEAIDLTNKLYPGLLEKDTNLMFALKCRQFVEMVNGTDSEIYRNNLENQTSVIQSTKLLVKSSVNASYEELNHNIINGTNSQNVLNGQIEDDIEMEDNHTSNVKCSADHQKIASNGFKRINGDDVEMGMTLQLVTLYKYVHIVFLLCGRLYFFEILLSP